MLGGVKKLGIIGVAAVLLLTGCASTAEPALTASEAPVVVGPDAFIDAFRVANSGADRATDDQWIAVGDSVCTALEAGATPNQTIDEMQGSTLSAEEAASAVLLATEHLCPEFSATR